jgi:hypothetical protein
MCDPYHQPVELGVIIANRVVYALSADAVAQRPIYIHWTFFLNQ